MIVLAFVGRHVVKTWNDLHRPGHSLRIEPVWVVGAGMLYIMGLLAFGIFFAKVMKASPTPVGLAVAVRAYVISHLGKYVPGKAMVVLMRVGLVTPHGARSATAAFATLYETLVMMASGATLAALGFGLSSRPLQIMPMAVASGLAVAFLVVVDPLVFPRLSRLMAIPFPKVGPEALPNVSRRLLGEGLLWSLAGWACLGLSQVAIVRALTVAGVAPRVWLLVTASVALATVAGFVVAVLPGGLGVREGVLMATLAPAIGHDTAVVAALTLRLTWVVAEGLAAALFSVAAPRIKPMPGVGEVS